MTTVWDLRQLLMALEFDSSPHWRIESQSGSTPTFDRFAVEPHEYLQWAEAALESETTAGDVHAILDAKRAIDAVTDRLLDIAGIERGGLSRARRMDAILKMNVAAPRILRRMTDTRNRLEHEYERPTREDAETAVDVATLFFAASRHLEIVFPEEFGLMRGPGEVGVQFSSWQTPGRWTFHAMGDHQNEGSVDPSHPAFPFLVGLAVAGHLEHREEEALAALRAALRL